MRVFILFGIFCAVRAFSEFECGNTSFPQTPNKVAPSIVGGDSCLPGDFPWQVAIMQYGKLVCGGMYILGYFNEPAVISAAHCFSDNSPSPYDDRITVVVFGLYRIDKYGIGGIKCGIDQVMIHEQYDEETKSNDIATIWLKSDCRIPSHSWVRPVCLPSRKYEDGEKALVSGWGTISEGGPQPDTLRYAWLTVLSLENCEKTGNAERLDSSMLCAAEEGKDACQGDSGGPLVAVRNGVLEAVGVVSWGFGCARDNYPGVYTDIFAFKDWIYMHRGSGK